MSDSSPITITIFGSNAGKDGIGTLQFKNCRDIINTDFYLVFTYKSASTGEYKRVSFNHAKLMGWSVSDTCKKPFNIERNPLGQLNRKYL